MVFLFWPGFNYSLDFGTRAVTWVRGERVPGTKMEHFRCSKLIEAGGEWSLKGLRDHNEVNKETERKSLKKYRHGSDFIAAKVN